MQMNHCAIINMKWTALKCCVCVCVCLCYPALKLQKQRKWRIPIAWTGSSIWNREIIKQNIYLSFGLLTTCNLVSSPNVERKTRSLTVDEVRSSRERTPEYCTNSNRWAVLWRDLCQKTEVRRWTLSAILVRQFLLPQNEGGSQNNVQPLVSPWSWDYTLLLPEDTGAVWRSFSHTCWVRPTAFTYKPRGSARINIPWLRQC